MRALALLGVFVGVLLSSTPGRATTTAQPFEGVGQILRSEETTELGPKAFTLAVDAARQHALKSALNAMADLEEIDPGGRRAAMVENFRVWTGAYRILESKQAQAENGADALVVRVEVQIDLRRIEKTLRRGARDQSGEGFQWGGVSSPYCGEPEILGEFVRKNLIDAGIVSAEASAASSLALEMRCEPLGGVTHTHLTASRVSIRAKVAGKAVGTITARGYGDGEDAARDVAISRALANLAERLSQRTTQSLHVRIYDPWPAARLRLIEDALMASVVGVARVRVEELMPDGSVVLEVEGSITAKDLSFELEDLEFADFYVGDPYVESSHEISVRLQ